MAAKRKMLDKDLPKPLSPPITWLPVLSPAEAKALGLKPRVKPEFAHIHNHGNGILQKSLTELNLSSQLPTGFWTIECLVLAEMSIKFSLSSDEFHSHVISWCWRSDYDVFLSTRRMQSCSVELFAQISEIFAA